jgi:integrase/recombinase XerD
VDALVSKASASAASLQRRPSSLTSALSTIRAWSRFAAAARPVCTRAHNGSRSSALSRTIDLSISALLSGITTQRRTKSREPRTCQVSSVKALVKEINTKDIQAWISFLKTPSPKGEGLSAKTVSRKLTALGNYFQWLVVNEVIAQQANPMLGIANYRISSPLPEILFEQECELLMTTASADPRPYLLFLLLLETGVKLEELFALKVSHFDFSNKYSPEMMIKHTGKKEKKSRKLKLPTGIIPVFKDYVARYKVDDLLFPYTQRFLRYLITDTAGKAGIKKRVSAQILRDTCAVRQLRREEGIERVLLRLGLSETTWEDAKVKYQKLSAGGYEHVLQSRKPPFFETYLVPLVQLSPRCARN